MDFRFAYKVEVDTLSISLHETLQPLTIFDIIHKYDIFNVDNGSISHVYNINSIHNYAYL